jgi:hypothetical protein
MSDLTISIDMDKKCGECGKGGATQNGLCLDCVTRVVEGKPMRSAMGKRYQAYWAAKKKEIKRQLAGTP